MTGIAGFWTRLNLNPVFSQISRTQDSEVVARPRAFGCLFRGFVLRA